MLDTKVDNQKLRRLIVYKFGSAKNFAKELGITEIQMSRLLNGKRKFTLDLFSKSAKLLGLENWSEIKEVFYLD